MDVFRFAKVDPRPNDPTRRYRIVRRLEKDHVGDVEIGGDAPTGHTVTLSVVCQPVLSDAAREDALSTARRFVDELVEGWALQLTEPATASGWVEQPDGSVRVQLEYRVS
ncbi:MAG: hypothetical protein K8U57_12560 [Planctomycetes bacterium]|nr:hypothetical protein [Planctomycetota bacterium]